MSLEDILSEVELSLMIAVGLRLEDCVILVGQILFAQSVISVGRDERPELRQFTSRVSERPSIAAVRVSLNTWRGIILITRLRR